MKYPSKTAEAVMDELKNICNYLGEKFSTVFKSITSDNGSEFADLSILKSLSNTKVYFTHPYSSFEKNTNERHNGLIRRFIPKGKRIVNYSLDDIAFIEDWIRCFHVRYSATRLQNHYLRMNLISYIQHNL